MSASLLSTHESNHTRLCYLSLVSSVNHTHLTAIHSLSDSFSGCVQCCQLSAPAAATGLINTNSTVWKTARNGCCTTRENERGDEKRYSNREYWHIMENWGRMWQSEGWREMLKTTEWEWQREGKRKGDALMIYERLLRVSAVEGKTV